MATRSTGAGPRGRGQVGGPDRPPPSRRCARAEARDRHLGTRQAASPSSPRSTAAPTRRYDTTALAMFPHSVGADHLCPVVVDAGYVLGRARTGGSLGSRPSGGGVRSIPGSSGRTGPLARRVARGLPGPRPGPRAGPRRTRGRRKAPPTLRPYRGAGGLLPMGLRGEGGPYGSRCGRDGWRGGGRRAARRRAARGVRREAFGEALGTAGEGDDLPAGAGDRSAIPIAVLRLDLEARAGEEVVQRRDVEEAQGLAVDAEHRAVG